MRYQRAQTSGRSLAELPCSMENVSDSEQGSLLVMNGPDEDGCVWLVSGKGQHAITVNFRPRSAVAEKLADWLAATDFGERE